MEAIKFVSKMLCPCCGSIRPVSVMVKQPDIEGDISRYRQHLAESFNHQAV